MSAPSVSSSTGDAGCAQAASSKERKSAGSAGPAHSAYDPLARIAAQMQHQIADAVGLGIGSPPDLVITESLQTLFDLGEIIPSQERPGCGDKRLACVSHSVRFLLWKMSDKL